MPVETPPVLPTIREALQWAAAQLTQDVDHPHAEAERLLASCLLVDRTVILAHPEWPLTMAQVDWFADAVQRRASGTPLPYLLGHVEFYGLEFAVTPAVLIPRPETELLVSLALARLGSRRCGLVVDVGTGSGCIAVALAICGASTRILATDMSAAALAIAHDNAQRHGVQERIGWVQADLLAPFATHFDLIISNPPYVTEAEWHDLPRSVRQEPRVALISGPEGLDAIGRLLQQAATRLESGGSLLMEIGEHQAGAAMALARSTFTLIGHQGTHYRIHQDLAGKDRVLEVTLAGPAD